MVNLIAALPLPAAESWAFLENWFLILVRDIHGWFGSYALAIVFTTLFIRLILIPVDIWQKYSQKKMSMAQAKMAPEMAKIQKQYGYDKNLLQQKQNELYMKKGMNPIGNCLSVIINMAVMMAVLFSMFGAINKMTAYKINQQFETLNMVYEQVIFSKQEEDGTLIPVGVDDSPYVMSYIIDEESGILIATDPVAFQFNIDWSLVDDDLKEYASDIAKKVYDNKNNNLKESFLWIRNIWRKEDYSSVIPSFKEADMTIASKEYFIESLGFIGSIEGLTENEVKAAVEAAEAALETRYNDVFSSLKSAPENQGWNGYFILTVLAAALSFLSMKLMTWQQNGFRRKPKSSVPLTEQEMAQQKTGKITQFIMPVLMGVFTLMNSATFAIYMISSYAITTLLNFGEQPLANLLIKLTDKIAENRKDKPKDPNKPAKKIKGNASYVNGMDVNNYKRPII